MAEQTPKSKKRLRTGGSTGESPPHARSRQETSLIAAPSFPVQHAQLNSTVYETGFDESPSNSQDVSPAPFLPHEVTRSLVPILGSLAITAAHSSDEEQCLTFLTTFSLALLGLDPERYSGLDPSKFSATTIHSLIQNHGTSLVPQIIDILSDGDLQKLCLIEELQLSHSTSETFSNQAPFPSSYDSVLNSVLPIATPSSEGPVTPPPTGIPRTDGELYTSVQKWITAAFSAVRNLSEQPIDVPKKVQTISGEFPSLDGVKPSMFFHHLRNLDASSKDRRDEIIGMDAKVTLLLNVSGAGKTMACAELLQEKPGLYITFRRSEDLGSAVMSWAMEEVEDELLYTKGMPAHSLATSSRIQARQTANYFIDLVFLSYFHVFLWFWEQTKDMPIKDRLRNWTYLQLLPDQLLPNVEDVFLMVAQELPKSLLHRNEVRSTFVRYVVLEVKKAVGDCSPFFIVLDEANVGTRGYLSKAFLSEAASAGLTDSDNRPFLRESFSRGTDNCRVLARWILSGTAMNRQMLQISINSGVAKFDEKSREFSDFGSFRREDVKPYAVKVLFRGIEPTDRLEQLLLDRMETYLPGRRRILVSFIELCLVIPKHLWNALLSIFFRRISETDRPLPDYYVNPDDREKVEGLLEPYAFKSLLSEASAQQLRIRNHDNKEIRALVNAMGDYLLFGRIDTCSAATSRLVQIGLARTREWTIHESTGRHKYVGPDLIDEPAAFWCIANCLKDLVEGKVRDLFEGFPSWESSVHGQLFERICFYNILQMLRKGKRLDEIFAAPPGVHIPWLDQSVLEVLTFESSATTRNTNWDNVMDSPVLAHKSKDIADTIEWFSREHHAAGLFPANNLGPDIIILVRREDGTVVLIEIQCKYLLDPDARKNVATPGEAVKTLDHRRWCIPLKEVAPRTASQEKRWQKSIHDKLADRGINLGRFEQHVLPVICCVERQGANHNWRKLARDYLPAEHIVTVKPEVATRSDNFGYLFESILGMKDPKKDMLD